MIDNYYKAKYESKVSRDCPTNTFELTFIMTTQCNFRCKYCYETKYASSIKLEDAYKLIDYSFNCKKHRGWWNNYISNINDKNYFILNFFGGECFLEVDKMDKICEYALSITDKFEIFAQTNGSLFQTKKVKAFLEKYKDHIKNIAISIDGCKEMHDENRLDVNGNGTYDKVRRNVMWFKKTYPNIKITSKATYDKNSVKYLYKSYLAFKEMGFKAIPISNAIDVDFDEESIKEAKKQYALIVEDLLKKENKYIRMQYWAFDYNFKITWCISSCFTGGNGITLYPDGKLYQCKSFTPLVMYPSKLDYYIGDIENGILDRQQFVSEQIAKYVDKNRYEKDDCKSCPASITCFTCPATNLKQTGSMDDSIPKSCKITQIEQMYAIIWRYKWKEKFGENGEKD